MKFAKQCLLLNSFMKLGRYNSLVRNGIGEVDTGELKSPAGKKAEGESKKII